MYFSTAMCTAAMAWLLLPLQDAPPGLALFNPSVVQYGGSYYAATRSLEKKQIGEIEWWLSGAHLCKADGNQPSFKGSSCNLFDPWKDRCVVCSCCTPANQTRVLQSSKSTAPASQTTAKSHVLDERTPAIGTAFALVRKQIGRGCGAQGRRPWPHTPSQL